MPRKTHTEQIDDYILFKETKEFFIFRNETGNEVLTKVLDITTNRDDDSVERNTILVRVEKL